MKSFKRSWTIKLLLCCFVLFVYYVLTRHDHFRSAFGNYQSHSHNNTDLLASIDDSNKSIMTVPFKDMVVAVVACGERLQETLTMLKSILLFASKAPLKFIIIADDELILDFKEKLLEWKKLLNDSFEYEILGLQFPEKDTDEWRKLFKPCASQRLFLPVMLSHIDSLIYVDTDTLFLSPVESLWRHFTEFNSSQMAALALEHDDPHLSWYTRFAKHPYYGKLGVNSGVMLMNLTRMRTFHWSEYVTDVYNQWRTQLTWGDQDIINIIFHFHSDKLFLLNCDANYRPDQCTYGNACQIATGSGARVLHGSRSAFHSTRQPAFAAVHKAINQYRLGTDPTINFIPSLLNNLHEAPESNCGKLQDALTKIPLQILSSNKQKNP